MAEPAPATEGNEARRTEMLHAAAELICERGFGDTRIADVAKRAGVSSALVIYYFGTRDRLLVDALRHSKPIFSKDGLMTEADAKVALTVLSSYDEKIRNARIDLAKTYTNRFVDQALKTVQ